MGLEAIDRSLEGLPDEELDAVIEHARERAGSLGDEAVAAIIEEAVRAVRRTGDAGEGRAREGAEGTEVPAWARPGVGHLTTEDPARFSCSPG